MARLSGTVSRYQERECADTHRSSSQPAPLGHNWSRRREALHRTELTPAKILYIIQQEIIYWGELLGFLLKGNCVLF